MNWEKTEELFKKGLLIDELKKIEGSNIEIQYPSKNFGKIYQQVVNYKKKSTAISVFITKLDTNENAFSAKEINIIRFDSFI